MAVDHSGDFERLDIDLERDGFCRTLLRHLSGTLEDIVGVEEASGFISLVGAKMGDEINETYRKALGKDALDREEVEQALVDLKRRIQGDFRIVESDPDKFVFENHQCPFGSRVVGRPSLCMMTSNVFGRITAENLGYGRVRIDQAIANGDPICRVVVQTAQDDAPLQADEREYFKAG